MDDVEFPIAETGGIHGALNNRNDPTHQRRDRHARTFYTTRRHAKKFPWVQRVAKNTGMAEEIISAIYDHVFIRAHDLDGGHKTFDPDYDMAESFRRLFDGKDIQAHDMILLRHERLEWRLMKRYGYPYSVAHELAAKKYNYGEALAIWKGEFSHGET